MENRSYKVIGKSSYEGTSKTGQKYTLFTYEIDYNDSKVKIKTFDNVAKIGDFIEVGIGVRKNVFGNELTAVVVGVHPAAESKK